MNLAEEIRNAIAASGGRASSSLIQHRLRQRGLKVNQHDVLKALRWPQFILTGRGWVNCLRQVPLFEMEHYSSREASRA